VSYVIGGGDWGQNVDEAMLQEMIGFLPTPDAPLEQMSRHLLRAPVEALRVFEAFLPSTKSVDFSTQQTAVEAIMGTIGNNPMNQGVLDGIGGVLDKLGKAINNLIEGWLGIDLDGSSEPWDPMNLHSTTQEIANAIAALNAQFNIFIAGQSTGNKATENFASYPNGNIGSKWSAWYRGLSSQTLAINNGKMELPLVFLQDRYARVRYTGVATKTDYQRVGVAFGGKPQQSLFGQSGANYIIGRLNNPDTDLASEFCFFKLDATSVSFGYWWRNATYIVKTDTKFQFNPAVAYWGEFGVPGVGGAADAPYTFRLYAGTVQVFEAIDAARGSVMGSLNRWTGMGFDNPTVASASVVSFAMLDTK
jgi:hypothetical protein